jgi:outer membrane protein assembly factor BamD (BamD/ComL family)
MAGTGHRIACKAAILFFSVGAVIAESRAQVSSQSVPDEAAQKTQASIGEANLTAPKPAANGEFQSAPKLFSKGKFAEAERQFAWIAQVRKGTTWGERSQYYLAECQYHQKKYVEALESLRRLNFDYPQTDYRDQFVRREYEIAQFWLAEARRENPVGKNPLVAVQVDGRPPIADTEKKALLAFEAVRHDHPTGPLADDAAMQIAECYMRSLDFESAAIYYAQFVNEYRKSPLCPRARLRGIQARTCSFLATQRDTASLKMAHEFAKPFLRSYFDFGDR